MALSGLASALTRRLLKVGNPYLVNVRRTRPSTAILVLPIGSGKLPRDRRLPIQPKCGPHGVLQSCGTKPIPNPYPVYRCRVAASAVQTHNPKCQRNPLPLSFTANCHSSPDRSPEISTTGATPGRALQDIAILRQGPQQHRVGRPRAAACKRFVRRFRHQAASETSTDRRSGQPTLCCGFNAPAHRGLRRRSRCPRGPRRPGRRRAP